jgi:DHA1 family bicyclomycin/chloramphenicol resistance-like MFS transporter
MPDSGAARPPGAVSELRLGLALGLLSTLGPVSIDLYLPAFPRLAQDLGASPSAVQRTLSLFLLALACAQIPVGSAGDRFGRKAPLYVGLGLFVAVSLLCALATSVSALIALRFLQGLAVCAGTAVSRAIIRDLRQGHEAARLMAQTFLVIGISPILAPLAGAQLLTLVGWRALFVVLAIAGLLGLAVTRLILPESLPPERRIRPGTPLLPSYVALVTHGRFLAAAAVAGMATTIPFVYLTAAPFVFNGLFKVSSTGYSALLASSAVCSIGTMQVSPVLMRRWGARATLLATSATGVVLVGVAAGALAAWPHLVVFQAFSMLLLALSGLLLAPAAATALDAGGRAGGAAAGMLGTLQLVITAGASALISLFPAFSLVPLLTVLGAAMLIAAALSLATGGAAQPAAFAGRRP